MLIAHRLTILVQVTQAKVRRLQQVQVAEHHVQHRLTRAFVLKQ